jgi:hypothetical protein
MHLSERISSIGASTTASVLMEAERVRAFGTSDHLRLSFASPMRQLEQGLTRMRGFCGRLQ